MEQAAWLFHYYLGSGRRGDRIRKIMAGGVAAEQNAHMEMVLKAEDEAMEMEIVASAAEAVGERGGGREEGAAAPAGGQQVCWVRFRYALAFLWGGVIGRSSPAVNPPSPPAHFGLCLTFVKRVGFRATFAAGSVGRHLFGW